MLHLHQFHRLLRRGCADIEKTGLNLHAQSLKVYREKYMPEIAIRTSLQNLRLDNGLLNIPLYMISELPRLLKEAGK